MYHKFKKSELNSIIYFSQNLFLKLSNKFGWSARIFCFYNNVQHEATLHLYGHYIYHFLYTKFLFKNFFAHYFQFVLGVGGGCDLIFYFLLFSAPKLLQILSANGAVSMIPELAKAIDIFTVIPATSCSAERSFSSLRRLKTYHCQVWLCCI